MQYISQQAALEALGDEPEIWDEEDPAEVQAWNEWTDYSMAIRAITPLPFELRPISLEELFSTEGKSVILSAPDQLGLTKKAVICNGLKNRGTHQWLDLNGPRYELGVFLHRNVTGGAPL